MTANRGVHVPPVLRGLVLAAALGFCPATQAEGPLAPPGQLYDLGSHRLHLFCVGTGSPTVIVDAGLGAVAYEWKGVQDRLAQYQKVCLYDRAGYGFSEPGPPPRNVAQITHELHQLTSVAGLTPPYVLVGHSFGGYSVQLYAKHYPQEVAGVVLVDASHPEQVRRFLDSPLAMNTAPSHKDGQVQYSGFVVHDNLSSAVRDVVYQVGFTPKARAAMTAEYLHFRDSADQVAAAGALPDRPLAVLSRGQGDLSTLGRMGIKRKEMIERLWLQLQRELADMAPRAVHLIAERSGHQIHLDQPEIIVDAVAMVSDFARAGDAASSAPRHWLAFRDVSWRVDRLHSSMRFASPHTEPSYLLFRQQIQAGHFAGTELPALQQVVYFE